MINRFLIIILLNVFTLNVFSINKDSLSKKKNEPTPLEFLFKPQLSVGVGMMTFYGDIGSNHSGYHPTVSRLGYDLRLINPLTDYLDVSFYVMFGQVSSNERTVNRNLNFNSNITTGGITLNYNFRHLLKRERIINPYVHLGIESVEFLSKTDLRDVNGNYYNYWSDGTIRDIAQNDANANSAVEIYRDYSYESDIREENIDGFGKYAERTWGVPIEIGVNLHTGKRIKLRFGTSMHFTFSDLIDGVTHESLNSRVGDDRNDKILYSHFALTYDLTLPKKGDKPVKPKEIDPLELYRQDTIDSDGDLVVDLADFCANTPLDARPVDEFGCPVDIDLDGVPDYRDQELNTPDSSIAKENGVAYSAADFENMYRIYYDSVGEFSEWNEVRRKWGSDPRSVQAFKPAKKDSIDKQLFIVLGSDVIGTSANDLHKELSNKNFKIIERGDSVLYVIGGFETADDLANEISNLKDDNVDIKGVLEAETNAEGEVEGDVNPVENFENSNLETNNQSNDSSVVTEPEVSSEIVYRVQVGAFQRKLSQNVFNELQDLVYVKGEDNLYRYYTGAFTDKSNAAMHKVNMSTDGYNGAFIVAFKDGERISLADAGFELNPEFEDKIDNDTIATVNAVNADLVGFRVQVGAYMEQIPTDVLDTYLEIGNVVPKRDPNSGLTKYFIGNFNNYDEATNYKIELIEKGIVDCFVVGEFKGNIITAVEAIGLLNN
ncbi:MAG: SPOR domain-containing protein [Flavobacteriales bacterium]|nr:SPOR domain-containing protein [Flavobacteriales bacterium]